MNLNETPDESQHGPVVNIGHFNPKQPPRVPLPTAYRPPARKLQALEDDWITDWSPPDVDPLIERLVDELNVESDRETVAEALLAAWVLGAKAGVVDVTAQIDGNITITGDDGDHAA